MTGNPGYDYYMKRIPGTDMVEVRQERYRNNRLHPHDICASGFTREEALELCEKYSLGTIRPEVED